MLAASGGQQLHPGQCSAKTAGRSGGGSCLERGFWWPALSLSSLSCLDEGVRKFPAQWAGLRVALLQGQALLQAPALPSGLVQQLQ